MPSSSRQPIRLRLATTIRAGAMGRVITRWGAVAVLGLLAACSQGPQTSATQEAAQYAAHAKHDYTPPGPPSDPWGPYIVEAAAKYDMPERWVREVVRQESGGRLYEHGQLITSSAGAMGLMQVMPATFDELRGRYDLGDDPFDPHDNIRAGTAYLRELYDIYGSPGFLAAYNAGPGRLDDYLNRNRPLPDETRRYVARIGANLGDDQPVRASQGAQLAMNQLPINIPAGPRYPRTPSRAPVQLADSHNRNTGRAQIAATTLPEPPRPTAHVALAAYAPTATGSVRTAAAPAGGFHIIGRAMADTVPFQRGAGGSGGWAIQVGAYGNEGQARAAADSARSHAGGTLGGAHTAVGTVRQANATLYRARLTGLSRDAAMEACEKISHAHGGCIALSPDAQS